MKINFAGRPATVTTSDGITIRIDWDAAYTLSIGRMGAQNKRGICAYIDGRPGHPTIGNIRPDGSVWPFVYGPRATVINGIDGHRLDKAVARLIDVAREMRCDLETTGAYHGLDFDHTTRRLGTGPLLDGAAFARRLGVTRETLRSYKSRGRLPEPDARLGASDGWYLRTVQEYARSRPGQGARTDLA